ncbi:Hint domain-containing protein [Pseudooceanicola sp. MF1-13]|uniref:Hint domain-containing protein n=1 Tax=Pseudooceanicola sp. MF1-13 TaxID=3379095 RepID=UPI00389189A2
MATYEVAGYDSSDIVIHSGADPFSNDLSANGAADGTIFSVTAEPDKFNITDNDTVFNDGDGSQDLAEPISQGGGTANTGQQITPEYMYRVRPVGGTAADDFYIYAYDADTGSRASGFVTEHRLVPGQQYQIIEEGPTNDPSIAYSSLYVCFTPGTRIATPSGDRAIETLEPGDVVRTVEGSYVPVRWIGGRELRLDDLMAQPENRPIRIAQGALVPNLPDQPLEVSPHHRIMLRSKIAERMFGEAEVLVPAHYFIGLPGVDRVRGLNPTKYIHLLVEGHQVLIANGTPAESLYVGKEARKMLGKANWRAVKSALNYAPFQQGKPTTPPARLMVDGKDARRLVNRHVRNHGRCLVERATAPRLRVVK